MRVRARTACPAGYCSARACRPRRWAQECMRKFEVGPVGSGVYIKDVMQLEEIRKGNKSAPIDADADADVCAYVCVCVIRMPNKYAPVAYAPRTPRRLYSRPF